MGTVVLASLIYEPPDEVGDLQPGRQAGERAATSDGRRLPDVEAPQNTEAAGPASTTPVDDDPSPPAGEAPTSDCSSFETALVRDWTYWIRRNGRLLAPSDDLDELKRGDILEVELRIDGACGECAVGVASFRKSRSEDDGAPIRFDRDELLVDSGLHVLTIDIPEDDFEVHLFASPFGRLVLDATDSRTASPK